MPDGKAAPWLRNGANWNGADWPAGPPAGAGAGRSGRSAGQPWVASQIVTPVTVGKQTLRPGCAWRLSQALPGEDLAMHISDAGLLDAAGPPADEPCQRRPARWTALTTLIPAAVLRVFIHLPGRVDRVDVRRRRNLDAAGGTATANARFTLGDPATDGLDFLLGGRLPQRRRGTARRTAVCTAIMAATLAGAVALSATGSTLPVVYAGPIVDAGAAP